MQSQQNIVSQMASGVSSLPVAVVLLAGQSNVRYVTQQTRN